MQTRRSSTASRAAILQAAKARFATDGYDRATIRAIASDARIDPSMVMRYFGSKADLFAAAVTIDLRIPNLARIPRKHLGRAIVAHFLWRWESGASDDALLMLLRSAATDETAAERMRGMFAGQLVPAIEAVVRNPDEARQRSGLISSQLLGIAFCRHILRLQPVADLDADALAEMVGPAIQQYLTGPLAR